MTIFREGFDIEPSNSDGWLNVGLSLLCTRGLIYDLSTLPSMSTSLCIDLFGDNRPLPFAFVIMFMRAGSSLLDGLKILAALGGKKPALDWSN